MGFLVKFKMTDECRIANTNSADRPTYAKFSKKTQNPTAMTAD